jgi:hypothetical protein
MATVSGFGNAIGFNFNSYFDTMDTGVIFSGAGFANNLLVPFRSLATNFFGVISDGPIGTINVTSTAQTFDFVSYTLQTAVVPPPPPPPPLAVPEPETWVMLVGGFGLIGGVLRRRREGAVSLA